MMSSSAQTIDRSASSAPPRVSGISVDQLYLWSLRLTIIGIVFAANIDLPRIDRSVDSFKTGPQAIIKFAILVFGGALGLWGWWTNPLTRRLLISIQGGLLAIVCGIHFLSATQALEMKIAFASGVAFTSMYFLAATALTFLGTQRVLFDILYGMLLYLIGCLVAYVVIPDMSVWVEVLGPKQEVIRIGGLGHPNISGRTAVYCGLFMFAACYGGQLQWRWFLLWLPLLLLEAAVSLSRTPVIAAIVTFPIVCLPLLRRPSTIYAIGLAVLVGAIGLLFAESTVGSERALSKFVGASTKTGQAEEIYTATGRTRIWQEAFKIASERPLLGHGAGGSPIVMAGFSGHAHNVFLEVAVNLGFPAAALVLVLMIWNLRDGMKSKQPILVASAVFIFVVSLAERPLFSPVPDSMSMIWFLTTLWPVYIRIAPEGRETMILSSTKSREPTS